MSSGVGDSVIRAGKRRVKHDEDLLTRIRRLEASPGGAGGCDEWRNVGDPGEPAFENSWDNAGGTEAPVGFMLCGDMVHIRGAFTGGADNTTVFTLPTGYRPDYQQEMVIPTTDPSTLATVVVGTNGEVVFLATIT